jgi:transposase
MAKYKEYNQHQVMLLPPSLEEKIEVKHMARYISRAVDALDIKEIDQEFSELGCRAYHPKMLLKILLYGYSVGIRSSRKIQKGIREDLVFMWLAGMQEPDFRTISDFRKGKIKNIKKLFLQILDTCVELGMVKCGKICIDGTKIEANSSRYKMEYRKSLEKRKKGYEAEIDRILEEADKVDSEEDRLYGNHDGYSLERVFTPEEIAKAVKKVQRRHQQLDKEKEKTGLKLHVANEKLERMGNDRNSYSNTDKDATLMLMKEGCLRPGYNVQLATENQVIVGYGIYERPNDNRLLPPMVKEVESNLSESLAVIIADKGYASQNNYEYLEAKGLQGAIPHQYYDYDRVARNKGIYKQSSNLVYEKLKSKMMDYLETEEGQALMDRRRHDVEPTIGDIKHNMGFRRFLLRLRPRVNIEFGLIAIAHNIKKIKSWTELRGLSPAPA